MYHFKLATLQGLREFPLQFWYQTRILLSIRLQAEVFLTSIRMQKEDHFRDHMCWNLNSIRVTSLRLPGCQVYSDFETSWRYDRSTRFHREGTLSEWLSNKDDEFGTLCTLGSFSSHYRPKCIFLQQ